MQEREGEEHRATKAKEEPLPLTPFEREPEEAGILQRLPLPLRPKKGAWRREAGLLGRLPDRDLDGGGRWRGGRSGVVGC